MQHPRSKVKNSQQSDGQRIARMLDGVIICAGLSLDVQVVSFPDQEIYRIKVYKLDSSGEPLYHGSDRKGFEFFRVEIKYPDKFSFWTLGINGKRNLKEFNSSQKLEDEAKDVLLELLCTLAIISGESR